MGSISLKDWEVWLAKVPFEDVDTFKVRPVLILQGDAYKMTPQLVRRMSDHQIINYQAVNLKKPTTVELFPALHIDKVILIKQIGELADVDRIEIGKIINSN